jgi:hypothetical protein
LNHVKGALGIRCSETEENRFCSNRRRDYYDAGNAGFGQDWLRSKPDYGITGWKVVAGPPGIKIGSEYCKPLRDAIERCKAKATRKAARKAQRNKIPNYTVKANGHGYWQPSATSRFLGFTSVDCGFDGDEARLKARALNEAASAGRKQAVVAENTKREAAIK